MRLLILGGTGFVGRALLDEALDRGHEVTVFNRGHTPVAGVAALTGDRTVPGGLAALDGGRWDLAVDTWSAAPAAVRDAAAALRGRVGRFAYVSSRSVYRYPAAAGWAEDAPVVAASPDSDGTAGYAEAKRGGELAARDAFGDEALIARAGLILGPYENVGRLPWWLTRIARGGPFLAPGPADLPLQYVDARDLAAFLLDGPAAGTYNVVSPTGHTTMGGLLDACVAATGADAHPVWTAPGAILDAGVQPWTDLPIWLPPGDDHDFMHRGDVSRAHDAGLRCRPVADTVDDTWAWLSTLGGPAPQRADRPAVGLDPAVEAALLSPGSGGEAALLSPGSG